MLETFPVEDFDGFARGVIQFRADSKLCIDADNHETRKPLRLKQCDKNLTSPGSSQNFVLASTRNIKIVGEENCLDTYEVCLLVS